MNCVIYFKSVLQSWMNLNSLCCLTSKSSFPDAPQLPLSLLDKQIRTVIIFAHKTSPEVQLITSVLSGLLHFTVIQQVSSIQSAEHAYFCLFKIQNAVLQALLTFTYWWATEKKTWAKRDMLAASCIFFSTASSQSFHEEQNQKTKLQPSTDRV